MVAMMLSPSSALLSRPVASRPVGRSQVIVHAAAGSWLPGSKPPSHLEKSKLAGNFGFDPASLGVNETALSWYQAAELINGRTAMTAVAGILIPSILTHSGLLSIPTWYDAGKVNDETNGWDWRALLFVEFVLCHWVEIKRLEDWKKPGSQAQEGSFLGAEAALKGKEPNYPGGPFDPLKLSEGPQYETYKLKEIKNARLAMVAFLGFVSQYIATGKDPIDNLIDHVSNPWTNNFTTNGISLPFADALSAPYN